MRTFKKKRHLKIKRSCENLSFTGYKNEQKEWKRHGFYFWKKWRRIFLWVFQWFLLVFLRFLIDRMNKKGKKIERFIGTADEILNDDYFMEFNERF